MKKYIFLLLSLGISCLSSSFISGNNAIFNDKLHINGKLLEENGEKFLVYESDCGATKSVSLNNDLLHYQKINVHDTQSFEIYNLKEIKGIISSLLESLIALFPEHNEFKTIKNNFEKNKDITIPSTLEKLAMIINPTLIFDIEDIKGDNYSSLTDYMQDIAYALQESLEPIKILASLTQKQREKFLSLLKQSFEILQNSKLPCFHDVKKPSDLSEQTLSLKHSTLAIAIPHLLILEIAAHEFLSPEYNKATSLLELQEKIRAKVSNESHAWEKIIQDPMHTPFFEALNKNIAPTSAAYFGLTPPFEKTPTFDEIITIFGNMIDIAKKQQTTK